MILWLTGNSGAGKSTLARRLAGKNAIILDGDDMRAAIGNGALDRAGREENCRRIARLAVVLESQGFTVLVAAICPYQTLRDEVQCIANCEFIYIPGGKSGEEYPYEPPTNAAITVYKE